MCPDTGREGRAVPRAARGRGVHHPQPVGRGVRQGLRGARASRRSRRRAPGSRSRSGAADGAATLEEVGAHVAVLDAATDLPVSVDLENGYGPDPRDAATRDRRAAPRPARSAARSRTTTPRGACTTATQAAERVAAAVEAARSPRLPLHAHRARREPHPRQSRPRRHDRPPAGLRGGRRRRPVRARACANGGRDPGGLRRGRQAGERARPQGPDVARDRRRRRRARSASAARLTWVAVNAMAAAAQQIRDEGDFSVLTGPGKIPAWLRGWVAATRTPARPRPCAARRRAAAAAATRVLGRRGDRCDDVVGARVHRAPPQLGEHADRLGRVAAAEHELAHDVVLDHREQRLGRQPRRDVVRRDAVLLVARDARLGALGEARDERRPLLGQVLAPVAGELGGEQEHTGVAVDDGDDPRQPRAQLLARVAVARRGTATPRGTSR